VLEGADSARRAETHRRLADNTVLAGAAGESLSLLSSLRRMFLFGQRQYAW
jgi:hypothetical protein